MPTDTPKRPATSPLCKEKITKFKRVDDLEQIEKTVAKYSPMFRIQWKVPPTPQSPQKWVTKAMVTIRNPMVWGRLLQADKERVINEEMRTTTVNQ